jgi:hypothetical protein
MPFDVDGAKKAGYSDDEIQQHLKSEYPKFDFDSAREAGYSLNEISSHLTKGGEPNEDKKPNQPEANSDRNARREANEQVTPVGSKANIQANVLVRPEDQGQRERNDQASITNEGKTENAQGGIQGAQAGQVLGSQVPAGNQEEVKQQETGVQAAFSKVRDFGAEALSSIGQSIYGSLAGIARTEPEYIELPSYGTKVKNPRYQESKDMVDFFERQKEGAADVEALGAKPLTGVAKTAADVTGGLLKLPAQAFTGPLGMASMIGEAFGSHKDAVYQKAKAEGLSDEDALNKANFEATASTAATLPLYYVGGKVAGLAADKLVSESAPKLAQVATRFGFNAVANSVASAASRGVTAALAGESITDAMKDVNVPGVIQDIAFAAHSTATHFQEQVAKGNGKEAARDLPDHALEKFAQDANYAEVVAPEVKARAESRMAQQAEQTNLPETAKVLEVSSEAERITTPEPPKFEEAPAKTITLEPITPETPPLAQGEAAPSLPKEEAQPPVSVAGEAPAVEPTGAIEKPSTISKPQITYKEAQDKIDSIEDQLEKQGVDVTKLYRPGFELLENSGYSKMPDELVKAYQERDSIGKSELELNINEIKSIIPKTTSENEVKRIFDKYALGKTDAAGQYMASEYTQDLVSRNPLKQAEEISYILADERGEMFDELRDISEKTKQDAVNIVKSIGNYFGIDHSSSFIKKEQKPQLTIPNEPQKQIEETSGIPTLESVAPVAETAVKAEEGVAQREGEGKEEVAPAAEARVLSEKFAKDPAAVMQEAIPEPTEESIQKAQLTRPDAQALGITPKGTAQTNFLIDSVKSKVEELGDAIKYRGKNIKDLRKVGVEDEANQHAAARIYVPVHVEELLGQVFGETKDIEKMRPTMDILVKDDIVGGYEDIVKQVNNLEAEKAQAQAEGRPIKAIENRIETLSKRGRDIEEAHPIEQYKQEIENASPEIQGNIERWKRHVVPEMDSLYNELKNVDPATEREGRGWKFGARLNLLSKTEEEKMASYGDLDKPMPSTSVSNYRNPNVKRDKFMQKASFLGDYSTDPVAILTNSLASRYNEFTKIRFYKALEDKGIGKIVAAGEEAPTMIGGKEVARLPIKFPETDPKTGITRVVEQSLYVQKGLEDSVKKVLDVDSKPQQNPLAKAFTGIQIIGVADATAHLKNLQNTTRNALGRDSSWADLTAKIPFLGQAQSVKEIANVAKEVASNSQKIRDEKAYLAKIGALRPSYPAEGVQRFLGTHQLLHDVDTATRIILNRRYDELVKRYGAVDTESARRDFINQVGNYNRRLMGRWETLARDTGFSPFIVAGRAMNRYARKMVTGDPGFQTDNVKGAIAARAAQMSGLIFATLVPSITNMFTTGNPFGRDGTPIGAIDFGPSYDTEEGKRRTFDVFALTGLRRGLRQFGIDSAIDGARSGKDIRDIERDVANGFITTKMHPWIGPAVGLFQETLTGKRLDFRTGYSQRYEARKIDGIGQYAENFRIALKQLNPLLYGVAGRGVEWAMKDIGGIPYPSEERASKENIGLISKAVGAPQVVGEIEGALEKPVMGAVGYKESQSEAIKLANSFGEAVQFTPEQDQRFTYRREIKDALAKGDKNTARDLYQQGFNDGILTEADKKSIGRYIKYPEKIVQKVQMIKTADQAVRVFRVATSIEQDAVGEIVARKIANSTTLRPEQKQKLAETFFASAKPNTQVYEIAKMRKKK